MLCQFSNRSYSNNDDDYDDDDNTPWSASKPLTWGVAFFLVFHLSTSVLFHAIDSAGQWSDFKPIRPRQKMCTVFCRILQHVDHILP